MISCTPFHKEERYDPVVSSWYTLDLSTTRFTKVAAVRSEIYTIKVSRFRAKKSTIKRYDVERCSWEALLSSQNGYRVESCVVAAGNHVYVCGGRLKNGDYVTKAERFDTVENKWEEIANMQQKRGNAFGVASEGKIFAAGGTQDWLTYLKTCEMFNVSTNEWQFIGSLNVCRAYGSMMCLKGTLYVLGGTSDCSGHIQLSVECYDPAENKWIEKTTIPVKMICKDKHYLFTGCVLKLSKGVLDKLDVVKDFTS